MGEHTHSTSTMGERRDGGMDGANQGGREGGMGECEERGKCQAQGRG